MTLLAVAGLGLISGGYLGFWGGVLLGAAMVDAARVSCFDGSCGYVAGAVALTGAGIGAAIGLAVSVMRRVRSGSETATRTFA